MTHTRRRPHVPESIRRLASTPVLDADAEAELLARFRANGDPRALEALVASHLRLVVATAMRFSREGLPIEDLVSEGTLGLVEAARRFDPDKGGRYATYARWWVRALIRRFALANRRIVGAPSTRNGRRVMSKLRRTQLALTAKNGVPPTLAQVAAHLGVSPDEVEQVDAALRATDLPLNPEASWEPPAREASPEEEAARRELVDRTRTWLAEGLLDFEERERRIVEQRLLADDGHTLAELGTELGVSKERVRQIELRVKDKLRLALEPMVA